MFSCPQNPSEILVGFIKFHRQVVPETTVELQEGSDAIPSACSCTNPNVPPEVSATYGASFDLW